MAAVIIFEVFIMGVVFMVFEDAQADSEVRIKIQDGDCDNFRIVHHGSRFHGFRNGRKSELNYQRDSGTDEETTITHKATQAESQVFNGEVKKQFIRGTRSANNRIIEQALARNKGSKVFAKLNTSRCCLTKLRTSQGTTVTSKPEILAEVEKFYGDLY